ncbi:MAG: DUF2818 family protein [Burkholderiaceae bacterium]|nr:DUF2818 family protein [Burkholderiaceae bacterium]
MNTGAAALLLLVLAACLANLPFVTERFFLVLSRPVKTVWWRLFELLVYYGLFIAIGRGLESYVGRLQSQAWQFYAITLLVFTVLAYPGFVFRYLRRSRGVKRDS